MVSAARCIPYSLMVDVLPTERRNIEAWLENRGTSPVTGRMLYGAERALIPNVGKRRENEEYVREKISHQRDKAIAEHSQDRVINVRLT